jgi:hypothetical protein
MLAIFFALRSKFEEHSRNKAIPDTLHGMYQKWLRYYLDLTPFLCDPFPSLNLNGILSIKHLKRWAPVKA